MGSCEVPHGSTWTECRQSGTRRRDSLRGAYANQQDGPPNGWAKNSEKKENHHYTTRRRMKRERER